MKNNLILIKLYFIKEKISFIFQIINGVIGGLSIGFIFSSFCFHFVDLTNSNSINYEYLKTFLNFY